MAEMARLNEENRAVNMRTVYLNASYFPGGRAALGDRDGGDPRLRRLPGHRRKDRTRRPLRVRRLPADLLRPDPADQPALHHLPAGDGSPGQDLRPARHRARHGRSGERDRSRRDPGEIGIEGVWFSYAEDNRLALATTANGTRRWSRRPRAGRMRDVDLHILPGQTVALVGETGAGKSTMAKLVARFYDPQKGRITIDGSRRSRARFSGAAQPARDRSPGGVPVQRHDRRERRLRRDRHRRGRRRSTPSTPSAALRCSTPCRRGSRPRSASAELTSQPVSGR